MHGPARKFLGRGWAFPPRFNLASSTVEMRTDVDDIQEALGLLLRTIQGERIMRPDFGLPVQVFAVVSQNSLGELATQIKDTITRFEPRVKVLRVEVLSERIETGEILVDIVYDVPAVNARANLVVPFYREEGTAFGPMDPPTGRKAGG